MQHLCAVICQLSRLPGMQLGNHARIVHDARIGRQQARYVFPEGYAGGAQRARQQRRRKVRSPAAERGDVPVRCLADESGHHGHGPFLEQRRQDQTRGPVGSPQLR